MEFSRERLITPDEILADVLEEAQDYGYREHTRGWYVSQMQQCLSELSFDTLLLKLFQDFAFPAATLALSMPENSWNIRRVYVYDGLLGDPVTVKKVRWKRGYTTYGAGVGWIADNKADIDDDPFLIPLSSSAQENIYFAEMQNGVITFSSNCADFPFVRLYFNGTITPIGETPVVPEFFRQAVKQWTMLEVYKIRRNKNPRAYRVIYNDAYNELYRRFDGTWEKAMKRAKKLDKQMADDVKEYLSKMNINNIGV